MYHGFQTLIMFVEHQILILEWFVKDHVTLKTGEMVINSALITGINYTLLYIHIENSSFTFKQYFTILLYFWSNNCSNGINSS